MSLRVNQNGRCPHCGVTVQFIDVYFCIGEPRYQCVGNRSISFDADNSPKFWGCECPACRKLVIEAEKDERRWLVEPRAALPRPIHDTVPDDIRRDFEEAQQVLSISPKASAALSRRCLQSLLIKQGATPKKRLVDQLNELYATFPSYVQSHVDHIRELGNLAAHPMQDGTTGVILDVDEGEADWLIEVLSELLDHYYTKPAEQAARATAVQSRIKNKKPMTN